MNSYPVKHGILRNLINKFPDEFIIDQVQGKFGGIICAGVMEHIEEDDVDTVLADIFSYADAWAFVFLFISCKPAKSKRLPDGRNVHLTVQPPEWWDAKLAKFQREGLVIKTQYDLP